MKSKVKFFKSKINWIGIVMVLGSLYDFLATYNTPEAWDVRSIGMLLFGVSVVILRTYFTQPTLNGGL